ncbi:MAG: sigma-70 family RNA polymerase sigma factor [Gemmataceae bacterium]
MPTRSLATLITHLARLGDHAQMGVSDAELLRRFAQTGDEAAFEWLVLRHGGLVLGTCRRILGTSADTDDAFQATFLALARRPGAVRRGDALVGWLHRVAVRVATRLRSETARHGTLPLPELAAPHVPLPDDTGAVLDEEIARLPEKLRLAFVLCVLDGRTDTEVAAQLGCPKGTVQSRLSSARERLRKRLTRRGLAPGVVGALAVAPTGVSTSLVAATVRAGIGFATGRAVAGIRVAALADGVLRAQTFASWYSAAALLVVTTLAVAGVVVAGRPAPGSRPMPTSATEPAERKPDAAAGEFKLGDTRFLHPAAVSQVLFSPDSKEVSTMGGGSLRWWTLPEGALVSEPIRPHDQKLPTAGPPVILSADNSTLVQVLPTAGRGSILAVIDPRSGKFRQTINVSDNVGLDQLGVSHNGKWAVGFTGKTVVVWNLVDGKKATTFDAAGVQVVAVSNDGKRVALTVGFTRTEIRSVDKGELVWEITKDYPPPKELGKQPDTEILSELAFSPDGTRLATNGTIAVPGAPFPGPVRIWDIGTRKPLWQTRVHAFEISHGLRFAPDGKRVGVVAVNLFLLEVGTGKVAHEFPTRAGATGAYALSGDGKWVAMAAGRRLLLWDVATHKELVALVGPRSPARLLARSSDGRTIATAHGGPEVWIYRNQAGPPMAVRASRDTWTTELGFDPTGTRLVTVARGNDNPVRVWDTATGRQLFALPGRADRLHRASLGRHGLFAVIDHVPGVYDSNSGKVKWTGKAVASHGNQEPLVVISPNVEYFATDRGVFAVEDGREVAPFSARFPLAVSDDGKRVAFRTKDSTIGLHVTSSIRQSESRVKVGAVYAIAPAVDRIAVVVGQSLRVYDLATSKEVCVCERPAAVPEATWEKWWARGVAFSPDGKLLVAHETTPGLGVWDAETGKTVAWFVPDVALPVAAYTFTGPKTVLAAYGSGDLLRLWDTEKTPRR